MVLCSLHDIITNYKHNITAKNDNSTGQNQWKFNNRPNIGNQNPQDHSFYKFQQSHLTSSNQQILQNEHTLQKLLLHVCLSLVFYLYFRENSNVDHNNSNSNEKS